MVRLDISESSDLCRTAVFDGNNLAAGPAPRTHGSPLHAFLELTDADFRLLHKHHDALASNMHLLASNLYEFLLHHSAASRDVAPKDLAYFARKQATRAKKLLRSRLDANWLSDLRSSGQHDRSPGVEPIWLSGMYWRCWQHWSTVIGQDIPAPERDPVRDTLFRLLVGDLVAQLDDSTSIICDTDTERVAVFDVLLRVLASEDAAQDPDGERLLEGICLGLVSRSRVVAWTAYATRDRGDVLIARCTAGVSDKAIVIPRLQGDPCWEAIDHGQPVICTVSDRATPGWMHGLRDTIAEVGCFPFGSGRFSAVGLVGAAEEGYFERVGAAYFLAFAHLGDLVQRMRAQSLEDPLTGLPNRRLFSERLGHAYRQGMRHERLLAVGLLDLDGFKQINDRLGHEAGDAAMQEVATRLQRVLRSADTLARTGSDEFGFLLTDLERPTDLDRICERVMETMRAPFGIDGAPIRLSASVGVTLFPFDKNNQETLLRHADLALYSAKEQGGDRWARHSASLSTRLSAHAAACDMLDKALQADHLMLYYQPIVDPNETRDTYGVSGVEALLRLWETGDRIHTPVAFSIALDHVRLARPIGRFVLDAALAQGERWHNQGLPLRVAVNISANHLLDVRFPSDLEDALSRHPGIVPAFVEIEITESAPLRDFDGARRALEACNALGVRVALDDFGTGNASLAYLQKLPAQTIKIDQSFVRNILSNPKDLAIVTGIVTTARMLGLEVIGEGVETARHVLKLAELQCHMAQGFAIARPMPAETIAAWVTHYRPQLVKVP
ncbi:MAG: EAL domain-containing protein [Betaproteobacteria bacterium]|nr:EAL domain-containing protein [Betaproteobacteria bacterium]